MATLWKKAGGVWSVYSAWSKVQKKVSGVWGIVYSRLVQLYTEGVENLPMVAGIGWCYYAPPTSAYTVTKYPAYIEIHTRGYDTYEAVMGVYCSTPIDVTTLNTLHVELSFTQEYAINHRLKVMVGSAPNMYRDNHQDWQGGTVLNEYVRLQTVTSRTRAEWLTLDVSAITGNVYVHIWVETEGPSNHSYTNNAFMKIYKAWID